VIVKWKLPSYLRQDQVKAFFSVVTSSRDKALFVTIYLYGLRVQKPACSSGKTSISSGARSGSGG
jgi:site-specific recombinase XerD